MGIADKLTDASYRPNVSTNVPMSFDFVKVVKCPVTFTNDPLEYAESFIKYKLKPVQKEILIDLFSVDGSGQSIYNHAVFISGMRCLGLGTEILMYDGTLKKIENICIGDFVMGPDSKPRKVLDTSRGIDKLYEVKQNKGINYIVNSQHILSLKRNYDYKKRIDILNIPVQDFLEKSERFKRECFGWKPQIPFEFSRSYSLPFGVDPYLCGLWIADGRKNSFCFSVNNNDVEILDYLNRHAILYDYKIKNGNIQNNSKDIRLRKNTKKLNQCNTLLYFKRIGLFKNKHIPESWKYLSAHDRIEILAGYLDGDGCVVEGNTPCFSSCSSNKDITEGIASLARNLGFSVRCKSRDRFDKRTKKTYHSYEVIIGGDLERIPTKLSRKKIYQKRKYDWNISNIKIKSLGVGPFAGITVDKDSLYCLSDGTVVHNSGKSIEGGIVGSFLLQKLIAMDDPGRQLGQVPGQKFVAEYIATSEQQSKQTAYAAFENIIMNTPWWRKYIAYLRERELKEGKETLFQQHERKITFHEKNVEAHSLHSNSASIAGFTAFFVCFDEMSRFDVSEGDVQQKSEKRSAQAVYYTAARAAKTLSGFSKILTITSPMYETDFGMQLLYMSNVCKAGPSTQKIIDVLRSRYTTRVHDVIGYHYCTYEANPKTAEDPYGYTEHSFDTEKAANYAAFMRDYMAIPPAAISPFFELPERIAKSVNYNMQPVVYFSDDIITQQVGEELRKYIGKKIQVLSGNKLNKYFICCDQGAVKDSFVVAMGHADLVDVEVPDSRGGKTITKRHKVIIDLVEAWKPNKEERITVSFQNVEEVIKILSNFFYISRVVFDQWHSTESIERLFSEGIVTSKLGATIEMYETLKVLIYSGMVDLPDNEVLLTELRQLNVIKNKKIEHPESGSKDLADAVCRVCWVVYLDSIRDAVHGRFMLPMGQQMSTVRSVATAFELMKRDSRNESGVSNSYGLFGAPVVTGRGVFGKSMIVQPNVIPNIGNNPLK